MSYKETICPSVASDADALNACKKRDLGRFGREAFCRLCRDFAAQRCYEEAT